MRRIIVRGIFLIVCLFAVNQPLLAQENGAWQSEGFAVVELFGSEGCSSCPPADRLLSELTNEARLSKSNIYTLSFHVDYWNYIGWVDPFSRSIFTDRQRQYARVLGGTSIYTPQMIINGVHAFVGSSEEQARKYIEESLKLRPQSKIELSIESDKNGQIEVSYHCQNLPPKAFLNVALVENKVESQVLRGENAGRLLKHDNVVREFKTVDMGLEQGRVSFDKGDLRPHGEYSIIAYLQELEGFKIIAAAKKELIN